MKNGCRWTSRIKEYAAKRPNSEEHRNGNAVRDFKRYVKTENSQNSRHIPVCHISRKTTRLSQKHNFLSMPKGIQQEVKV